VHGLLHDAITVVPELAELELEECTVRFRPATNDNLPLVGPTLIDGLLLASGHGRDGILLAPLTMQAIVAAATGAPPPPDTHHLDPQRFTTERTRR
jgi:glycine oxidase